MHLRGETFCERAPDSELSEVEKHQPKGSGSSYCNPHVGLVSVGTQVSGRLALCRGCDSKIARGSVRFGYSYSKSKFEAYVHASCIAKYMRDKSADVNQALKFLNTAKQAQQLPVVQDAIVQLERDLSGGNSSKPM